MDTTTILPTPPTSGAVVQTSNGSYGEGFFPFWATINEVNRNGAANLQATHEANVADLNAINLASVAGINATNLGTVSVTKNVNDGTVSVTKSITDAAVANINATSLASVSVTKAVTDLALSSALTAGETRELINTTSYASLIAAKDNGFAIRDEGCKTRETILTTSAAAALQACKDAAELAKQIAECCCEQRLLTLQQGNETRALILSESTKRCEADNAALRQENLLLRINEKGNGK